jgi:hypothetical protein
MVTKKKFESSFAGLPDLIVIGIDLHPFVNFGRTCRLKATHTYYFNHAQITRGEWIQPIIIT